ncbi:MAG TPA: hypothetical protein VGI27_01760 [Solirubrobacteraceae bacterium]|jgi:serine O-acetyltransferase
MSAQRLGSLRLRLTKLWLISPEKLWLASIALQRRGHWILAFAVKQLNTVLYHNSLAPEASVGPDIALGHYSHGVVVARDVEIGRRVKIWHNVTLTAGRSARRGAGGETAPGPPSRILVEDGVKIGTNAVIIAPRGRTLRIGCGARIGAGAIVTEDVPAGATVVSQPVRVLLADATDADADADARATNAEAARATDAEVGFRES